MNIQNQTVSWRFWGKWVLATFLGLVVGMILFIAVGTVAGEALDNLPEFVFGMVIGTIFGLTFGYAQWRILRQHIQPINAWIWTTFIGFVVGAIIIFGLMDGGNPDTSVGTKLGHGVVLGSTLGVGQWSAIRQKVSRATLWIAASIVAWIIAEIVGMGLSTLIGSPLDLLGLFLVGGCLPGIGMMWLLKHASAPNE